ncbi:MAG: FitA-like ribbon-helix-helix domain-containing protein [Terriglobales bacterium]
MATLNIKQFPDRLYRRLQARAKRERRSLAQEVILILHDTETAERHSIFELEGVGAALWRKGGEDAAAKIRKDRDSWD